MKNHLVGAAVLGPPEIPAEAYFSNGSFMAPPSRPKE